MNGTGGGGLNQTGAGAGRGADGTHCLRRLVMCSCTSLAHGQNVDKNERWAGRRAGGCHMLALQGSWRVNSKCGGVEWHILSL